MYYIKKYSNGWAIHNDKTGASRLLSQQEIEQAKKEFPELLNEKTLTVFSDVVNSVKEKP